MLQFRTPRNPLTTILLGMSIAAASLLSGPSPAEAGSVATVGGSYVNKKNKALGTFQGTFEVVQFRVQGGQVVADALLDGNIKNKRGRSIKNVSDGVELQFNLGSFAMVPSAELDFASQSTSSTVGKNTLNIASAAFSYATSENAGFAPPLGTLTALLSSPNPDLNALAAQLNALIAIENDAGNGGWGDDGDDTFADLEEEVRELINQYRVSVGLPALAAAPAITQQARQHSLDMANGTVPFGHDGFQARVDAIDAAIPLRSAGENVAAGYPTAESVVQGWLNSPGHLANIEGTWDLTGIGIAVDEDGYPYYTQIFILSN